MTLTGPACVVHHSKLRERGFVSVGLHRGCDTKNASARRFGSTLALYSIEFWAVSIVARALP
jgi:hypothetical protein